MAVADAPGLMDIASTLVQDDIPFKLRCAICNKLAVNAFRLPCCDQSICEACQTSLSDTCPVCTHTPVSPDLCKPNKALRTTLKAFLRTEEKKREKDRQSAAPPTPSTTSPADTKVPVQDAISDQDGVEMGPVVETEAPPSTEPIEPKPEGSGVETSAEDKIEASVAAPGALNSTDQPSQDETAAISLHGTGQTLEPATEDAAVVGSAANGEPVSLAQEVPEESDPNSVAPGMAGNTAAMGWNGNGMNPFMAGMFNYPNTMGMPMGMGPMANQGMFGGYGMNMTGMGMNTGMNYNGGMYGSLGWDASQQNNNMWQGGQNKFNPNAFANGTGPPYGGAFGGSNISAYPSHSDYQSGYYGGYGRGGFRGRGRGQFHGPSRGGFGPMQAHYRQGTNAGYANQTPNAMGDGPNVTQIDAEGNAQTHENVPESGEGAPDSSGNPDDTQTGNPDQPQGIPTIESLDNSVPTGPAYGHMNSGYAQHRYGRYGQERGTGVEGAPAAPRAMREGLPNTSVLRQRGFQVQGRANISGDPTEESQTRATSRALSQRAQSRSRSPSQNPAPHPRSPSVHGTEDERGSRRGAEVKGMDRVDELQSHARYSRSPSRTSSRRSSRRRHHESDRERDRRTSHRSHRSRRHRSRSRSSSRNRGSRTSDRLGKDKSGSDGRTKASSEAPESRDLASRISSSYRSSKDRVSRRDDDRSRDEDRDIRRRDRDRDRDRDRRGRDRDSDRDRRRDSERDRERPRERERDRKRSRRDRSPSANGSDYPQSRRARHDDEDHNQSTNGTSTKATESEKDPYTLEREARNKERLEREKQHRDKAKSGRRRDSRQDRMVAGRRINYKYEDEL